MQDVSRWKLFFLFALLVPCWVIAERYDIDLVNLHVVAEYLHTDVTRVYAQNGNYGRYFYGPFSLVLIKPLGLFSYVTVKWFWILLQTVCYVVFWLYLYRLYPFLKSAKWAWLLVFIVSINPIHNNYQSNNIQLMLAAVILIAEALTYSSSSRALFLAGVLVSLTASIKMFPLFLVVYYFLVKPNATRIGVVAGMLFAQALPFLYFGWNDGLLFYRDFISNLTTYDKQNSLTGVNDILCLPSLVARWFPEMSGWLSKVLILVVSAAFYLWAWLKRDRKDLAIHFWALANALMVFLNPSTRPHYFIFYVPAFCSMVVFGMRKHKDAPTAQWLTGVACLLIAFTAEGVVGKNWNEYLESRSYPTLGMLLLCGILTKALSGCGDDDGGGELSSSASCTSEAY